MRVDTLENRRRLEEQGIPLGGPCPERRRTALVGHLDRPEWRQISPHEQRLHIVPVDRAIGLHEEPKKEIGSERLVDPGDSIQCSPDPDRGPASAAPAGTRSRALRAASRRPAAVHRRKSEPKFLPHANPADTDWNSRVLYPSVSSVFRLWKSASKR